MKEVKNDIIKKYKYKKYAIYIKEVENNYECYFQNEVYCEIGYMYCVSKEEYNLKQTIELIKENFDEWVKLYKFQYED